MSSIIFLDLPVGTGFSYATTPAALQTSDLQTSDHAYQFLRKVITFIVTCDFAVSIYRRSKASVSIEQLLYIHCNSLPMLDQCKVRITFHLVSPPFRCLNFLLNLKMFLQWFVDHPTFLKNPLYIGGDSYSGMVVPIISQIIASSKTIFTSLDHALLV